MVFVDSVGLCRQWAQCENGLRGLSGTVPSVGTVWGAVGGDCVSVILVRTMWSQDWGRRVGGSGDCISVILVGTGWGGVRGDCVGLGQRDLRGEVRGTVWVGSEGLCGMGSEAQRDCVGIGSEGTVWGGVRGTVWSVVSGTE